MTDPYQTLGLRRDASQEEIRNAYRKLAKKHHPDLNPGNKEAERKFKNIQGAYDLLETPEKRAKFDRGEATEPPPAGADRAGPYYYQTHGGPEGRYGGFSFEDLFGGGASGAEGFESIFGGARGAQGPRPGRDEQYQMDVEFKDAVLGAERQITLPSGKTLQVKIPPGVATGSRLRFAGQGSPGRSGGPSGDAYVEIRVRPSSQFRREGRNLETDLSLTLAEALLGAEVRVPVIDGNVLLKIPPRVSSGARLRIKGKGVPSSRSTDQTQRGDQFVVIQITMPKEGDAELEAAVRAWAERHPEVLRQEGKSRGP